MRRIIRRRLIRKSNYISKGRRTKRMPMRSILLPKSEMKFLQADTGLQPVPVDPLYL